MHTTDSYCDRATPLVAYIHRHTELLSATAIVRYPVLLVDPDPQLVEDLARYTNQLRAITAADLPTLEVNPDTCLISAGVDYCPAEHPVRHARLLQGVGRALTRIGARYHGTRTTAVHVTTAARHLAGPARPLWPAASTWAEQWGRAMAAATHTQYDDRHMPGPALARYLDLVENWDYGALCLWKHPVLDRQVDLRLLLQT